MTRRIITVAAACGTALSVAAALPATATAAGVPATTKTAAVRTDPKTIRSFLGALDSLRVAPRTTTAYSRAAYGAAWTDVDGNGCSQRQDALWRGLDRTRPATIRVRRTCTHEVYAGTWVDPYTGKVVRLTNAKLPAQAQRVQIDHVVALAEADRSGAHAWTPARKLAYANDLVNLVAADGAVNQGKSAYDAASWRPKGPYQCAYAARVVTVKKKWALAVDPAEKASLTQMLATCATNSVRLGPPVPAAKAPSGSKAPTKKPTPKAPSKKPARPTRDYDCTDFSRWADANRVYRAYFPYYGDVFRLDSDRDGVVCESLPGRP